MINMCFSVPLSLPPGPVSFSQEEAISSDPSSIVTEDEVKKDVQLELKEEDPKVLEEEKESNVGGEEALEEQDCEGGGKKFVVGQESDGCEVKVLGEQEPDSRGDDDQLLARNGPEFALPVGRRSPPQSFSSRLSSAYDESEFNNSNDLDNYCRNSGPCMNAPLWPARPPPSPRPVGAGLANMGNTCFLNAVMQCFTHTVPLVLGLQSLSDDGGRIHHNEGDFCVLSAVRNHVFRAWASPEEVMFPEDLVYNLKNISSFFERYQQEDAHEFLQCLLDKTDTCWSKWKAYGKGVSQGDSLVNQVFGGRLVSQLDCCKCGGRSDTYEPLVDLSLEIDDADDINGALKSFTKMEEIEDDDVKVTCEKCKQQVPVKKQLLIDKAPAVATLHLKRFKGDGYYVEKVDKFLEYPLELDLKPYTVGDENVDLKYELYAVIVHAGYSSTSGHYLCYIRSSPSRWFRMDDSKICEVQEVFALSQQAYILFYARKGTPWPCSLVKTSRDNGIWNTSPKSVLDILEHTHNSRACLYNEHVGGSVAAREVSTELQQVFGEACSVGPSRNSDDVASSEPSNIPENKVDSEGLIDGNSSSLSGAPKDIETEIIGSVDAKGPIVVNDSSSCRGTGSTANLSTPTPEGSIEHKTNGFKGNANIDQPSKSRSRSPSPDVYSEFEDHPETAYPQPLKKPKVDKSAKPKKANTVVTHQHDRKRREAMRSISKMAGCRRQNFVALLNESSNGGSASKKGKPFH